MDLEMEPWNFSVANLKTHRVGLIQPIVR